MAKHILGPDNEPDSKLREVLSIEGHFRAQSSWGISPRSLDELLVNILSDDLV